MFISVRIHVQLEPENVHQCKNTYTIGIRKPAISKDSGKRHDFETRFCKGDCRFGSGSKPKVEILRKSQLTSEN